MFEAIASKDWTGDLLPNLFLDETPGVYQRTQKDYQKPTELEGSS